MGSGLPVHLDLHRYTVLRQPVSVHSVLPPRTASPVRYNDAGCGGGDDDDDDADDDDDDDGDDITTTTTGMKMVMMMMIVMKINAIYNCCGYCQVWGW